MCRRCMYNPAEALAVLPQGDSPPTCSCGSAIQVVKKAQSAGKAAFKKADKAEPKQAKQVKKSSNPFQRAATQVSACASCSKSCAAVLLWLRCQLALFSCVLVTSGAEGGSQEAPAAGDHAACPVPIVPRKLADILRLLVTCSARMPSRPVATLSADRLRLASAENNDNSYCDSCRC